MIMKVP
jgi:hypothetical protein